VLVQLSECDLQDGVLLRSGERQPA
jgi:hypothetical protein